MNSEQPTPSALLDTKAVADFIGASARTVTRLAQSGRMPRPFKVGALTRWRRSDLEDWVARGCPSISPKRRAVEAME